MLAGRAPPSFEATADQEVPIYTAIVNAEYLQIVVATLLLYDISTYFPQCPRKLITYQDLVVLMFPYSYHAG